MARLVLNCFAIRKDNCCFVASKRQQRVRHADPFPGWDVVADEASVKIAAVTSQHSDCNRGNTVVRRRSTPPNASCSGSCRFINPPHAYLAASRRRVHGAQFSGALAVLDASRPFFLLDWHLPFASARRIRTLLTNLEQIIHAVPEIPVRAAQVVLTHACSGIPVGCKQICQACMQRQSKTVSSPGRCLCRSCR